jgi:hypothetical protein
VLVLTGTTLTWSPRDPLVADWVTNIYDLWDPPPFQISLQAQNGDGLNFGPESNKITWAE